VTGPVKDLQIAKDTNQEGLVEYVLVGGKVVGEPDTNDQTSERNKQGKKKTIPDVNQLCQYRFLNKDVCVLFFICIKRGFYIRKYFREGHEKYFEWFLCSEIFS
jgi:hypothetical protein